MAQIMVVGLVVAAAVAYTVWKIRRQLTGAEGCSCSRTCGVDPAHCSAAQQAACKELEDAIAREPRRSKTVREVGMGPCVLMKNERRGEKQER